MQKLREECGVFGIYAKDNPGRMATTAYYGLFALQHRGQESCGIAVVQRRRHCRSQGHRPGGGGIYPRNPDPGWGQGHMAVGHVRYGTTGSHRPKQRPAH